MNEIETTREKKRVQYKIVQKSQKLFEINFQNMKLSQNQKGKKNYTQFFEHKIHNYKRNSKYITACI